MKRVISILHVLFFAASLTGQNPQQLGIVKTIGRPDKPGEPVHNATIRIRGLVNPVISSESGEFCFSVPGKKDGDEIVLMSVQKSGFELKDKDMIGRPIVFSSKVPLDLLLVDLKQLAADKARIEENAYRAAEKRYRDRMNEIEKQVKENEITAENYQRELEETQKNYERYLALISDMADRYARADYDEMDSIDREINLCIENGDLLKADSLIHTVFDPNTVLEKNRAAKEEIRQRIEFAQKTIDKANSDRESIMKDLEYANELDEMCKYLAEEYLLITDTVRACECLEKALEIEIILHGDYSPTVVDTRRRINELKR